MSYPHAVGQLAEYGKTQEVCRIVELSRTMALVRFADGRECHVSRKVLAWVPSAAEIERGKVQQRDIRESELDHPTRGEIESEIFHDCDGA